MCRCGSVMFDGDTVVIRINDGLHSTPLDDILIRGDILAFASHR